MRRNTLASQRLLLVGRVSTTASAVRAIADATPPVSR